MEERKIKKALLRIGGVFLYLFLFFPFSGPEAQTRSFLFDIRSAAYKGIRLYEEGNYGAAIPLLEQAVKQPKKQQNQLICLSLAHAYAITGSAGKAAEWYSLLKDSGFELQNEHLLLYANALMANGKPEEGRQEMMACLAAAGLENMERELRGLETAAFYRDSVRYSVSPVSVNTEAAEFSPVVVPYGILFVSERPEARLVHHRFAADESSGLDIFYGRITDGGDIRQMIRLNKTVNSSLPEGPVAIFNNGKKLVYTRSLKGGRMQLYQAKSIFNYTTWFEEEAVVLPVKGSVGHPAVADHGQVLYFISDMPGGFGGTDIYRIERTKKGWTKPQNLGPKVNTAGNEMFPVLNGADKLHFASNGHMGLGGLDIYEASLAGDSVVMVRNMGAPVNSAGDDFGLSLHGSGTWGYFSSNRAGGAGSDDIYRLDVHVVTLAGRVYDKTNSKNVNNARVGLYQDDVLLQEAVTDKSGSYSFRLYPGQEYELRYLAEEFREFKEVVSTRQGPRYGTRKWETGLDRKVKMYVLGTIKNGAKERAADAEMIIIDQSVGRTDTVVADKKGNYEMELDAISRYTFVTACDEEAAVTEFSTPERGKASLSYYVNIELQPATSYKIRGLVRGRSGEKGPFVISRYNKLTQEHDYVFTDEQGQFTFVAHSTAGYELCLMHEKGAAPVSLTSGWSQPERTVLLSW